VAAQFGTGGFDTPGGCTLTQGYWKNHPNAWPVDSLQIGGETYSKDEALVLLKTSVSGDGSLILAHQMIAAMLNVFSGASADMDTVEVLVDAENWMLANKDADGRLPYGIDSGTAAHEEAAALADALASFNEGGVGPGHCDDGPPSGTGGSSSASSGDPGTGGSSTATSGSGGGSGCVMACGTAADCAGGEDCIEGCCVDTPE